jgi:hypothetical protein
VSSIQEDEKGGRKRVINCLDKRSREERGKRRENGIRSWE